MGGAISTFTGGKDEIGPAKSEINEQSENLP